MQDVVAEFEELVLADVRLVERVRSFVGAAWGAPGESFPRMLQDAAQLEGAYRLLSNPRVTSESLRAPHARRTVERAQSAQEVVVVHDTTEVETAYAAPSEVGYLKTGRTGYQAHVSLAALRPRQPVSESRPRGCPGLPPGCPRSPSQNRTCGFPAYGSQR